VIPLLLEFPADIPATQVDIAVAPIMYSMDLARSLASCLPDPANTTLLTHVCDLTQLSNLPLSVVRQGAIALAAESQGRPHPLIAGDHPRTRSSLLLRYIVGQQLTTTTEPLPRQAQFSCADLCALIARTVRNALGVSCDVAAFYGGGFHQPLYTAMWLYQTRRLRLLAASELAAAGCLNRVAALITQHGTPAMFRLEVRFCPDDIGHSAPRAYMLRSRPLEDPRRCSARVAETLRLTGMVAAIGRGPAALNGRPKRASAIHRAPI